MRVLGATIVAADGRDDARPVQELSCRQEGIQDAHAARDRQEGGHGEGGEVDQRRAEPGRVRDHRERGGDERGGVPEGDHGRSAEQPRRPGGAVQHLAEPAGVVIATFENPKLPNIRNVNPRWPPPRPPEHPPRRPCSAR